MDIEEHWRQMSDAELTAAAERFAEYTLDAEGVIRAEMRRRSMPEPLSTKRDPKGHGSPEPRIRMLEDVIGPGVIVGLSLGLTKFFQAAGILTMILLLLFGPRGKGASFLLCTAVVGALAFVLLGVLWPGR